jgi:hypothetical protein
VRAGSNDTFACSVARLTDAWSTPGTDVEGALDLADTGRAVHAADRRDELHALRFGHHLP